jgi:hypothetical protein
MMFNADAITFQEYMMQESLPLATIQTAVLEFLSTRDDVVLFGAQAVNAYVKEPRMTEDIDILSTQAETIAELLRSELSSRFQIAVCIRTVAQGQGFRLYQLRKEGNRHLVDIRQSDSLPASQEIAGIPVLAPTELIASKVISYYQRRGKPKSGTDWRDLAFLILAFPELKTATGPVTDRLKEAGAGQDVLDLWLEFVAQEIEPEDDEY